MARRRKSTEIQADLDVARATVLEVADLEEPTDDDITRSDTALDSVEALEVELADAVEYEDRVEAVRSAAANTPATEPGDQRDLTRHRQGRGPEVIVKSDPFEILRTTSTHHMNENELSRAYMDANLRALETLDMPKGYDGSAEMYLKRHRKDIGWSRNLLARATPDYLEAWEKAVTGREYLMSDVERAAIAVSTNTAGGHLVPTHLDPTLILTNSGAKDIVRQMSRVVSLTGGANTWRGVSTTGSTASWDGELTEVSDDTPAFAPVSIPVFSAKSLIQASIESFEDIANLAGDVQMMLADSRVRLEAVAHLTGNGTSAPCGIFTALDANTNVEISLTTGSTFTRADLAGVVLALGDRWDAAAEWLMHPQMAERIAALGTALSASYSVDMTQQLERQILSHKLNTSFSAPNVFQTTTVDNLLVYGDFSNFVIVDKPGSTSIEFIPHMFNTSNNLPDGRRAWYMHFRNGSDSVNDLAFRLLQDKTTA